MSLSHHHPLLVQSSTPVGQPASPSFLDTSSLKYAQAEPEFTVSKFYICVGDHGGRRCKQTR